MPLDQHETTSLKDKHDQMSEVVFTAFSAFLMPNRSAHARRSRPPRSAAEAASERGASSPS